MKKLRTLAIVAAIGCAAGAIAALTLSGKGKAILQTAQEKVGDLTGAAKPAPSADAVNPELRQKIEEARQRIAAQVAQDNAAAAEA